MLQMYNNKQIRIYHSHIEISPYKLGESERIERMLSIWIDAEYRYDPIAYYILNDTLYVPRGISQFILQNEFETEPFLIKSPDKPISVKNVKMIVKPRDRIQEESIDFLTCEGKFKNAWQYSQQALILDTGDGKTYTTINSIIKYHQRAIIITHQDKIKQQWIDRFKEYTNVNPDRLINITGSNTIINLMKNNVDGDFFFVNHQTIKSYGKTYGWENVRKFFKKCGFGIKVYDEAHLSFKNVLMIDFFSNTRKTFYLTANFGRSDTKEEKLYKSSFSSVYKFGEETKNYEEKRKHIVYIPVLYRSNPNFNQLAMASNAYGFSVLGFSKYALHEDEEKTQIRIFEKILNMCIKINGKILITIPKISDTEFLKDWIYKKYGVEYKIMTINSTNTPEENASAKIDADIICSTIKSCGTGVDIPKLRCIINLEPFSSNITTNQLSGRLREYSKDKDTYFFDLIDISFPVCERQYKQKLRYLKKKCKEIKIMNIH